LKDPFQSEESRWILIRYATLPIAVIIGFIISFAFKIESGYSGITYICGDYPTENLLKFFHGYAKLILIIW
jgi:hypothetical protein